MSRTAALWDEWTLEDVYGDPLGLSISSGSGTPFAVTFPTTNLVSRVQVALGADLSADPGTWNWLDITDYVRFDVGVSLTTGRRDEQDTVTTGSAQLKLDNRLGYFTRRNPNGPYFGLLSKNTPIWATVDAGSGEKTRLEMFVNEWPTRWFDKSTNDCTVTIQCAGIMRRLQSGRQVRSAPYQYLSELTGSDQPVAAWTLEDGPLVSGARPLYGTQNLTPWTGTHPSGAAVSYPQWGQGDLGPWLPPVTSRSGSSGLTVLAAAVSMPAFATTWTVDLMYASGTDAGSDTVDGISATVDVNPSYLPGGAAAWPQLIFIPEAEEIQVAMNGEPETSTTVSGLYDGLGHHIRWTASQSGGNVTWTVYVDGVSVQTDTTAGAMTLAAIASIGLPAVGLGGSQLAQGYVAVWTTPPALADAADAALGHRGEQAHERIARLCDEQGVPHQSSAPSSPTMGPQGVDTFLNLLRAAEAVGGGVLYEKRWGLAYQSLAERYNQPVGLALDFDQGHIAELPEPADDDQRTLNLFTASRSAGSEYTAEVTTGLLGTGTEGPGVYSGSATLDVELDTQLKQQAEWRVLLGTVDEDRYPSLALNFAHDPDLIDTWCSLGYGARLTLANPLDQMAPDTIDQIIEGHSEHWNQMQWSATMNCAPFSPYRVFLLAGPSDDTNPNLGYMIPTTCALAEDLTTTEQGVDIVSDPYWNTTADNWTPAALITCEGEDMSVSDVGHIYRDNFTRVEVDGWGSPTNGAAYTLVGTAANFDVTGTVGTIAPTVAGSNRFATVDVGSPDQDITGTVSFAALPASGNDDAGLAARFTDSSDFYRATLRISSAGVITVRLTKAAGGSAVLVTSSTPNVPAYVAADQWKLRFSVRGSDLKVKAWPAAAAEPAVWDITTTDSDVSTGNEAGCFAIASASTTSVMSYDSVTLLTPQRLTVTRSVNTIVKTHPTGATVAFKAPGFLSL